MSSRSLLLSLTVAGTLIAIPLSTPAQIQPDDTLGAESSQVIRDVEIRGFSSDRVEGGAIRGNNLFHSFQKFNIQQGRGAYFANPASITNIFSRVTGSNPSEINGTLGVLGNANLFFLNPNGMIFGSGARLDLNGAFVATTGSAFLFPNGSKFGTINPQSAPILSVNVTAPVGIELAGNSGGRILVQGSHLKTDFQQTLALIGGDIRQQGGSLEAPNGNMTLISLAEEAVVEIGEDFSFQLGAESRRGNISLSEGALVSVLGEGGEIQVETGDLTLRKQSLLQAGISPESLDLETKPGNILINSVGDVLIDNSEIRNTVQQGSVGDSGSIEIQTDKLTLQAGGLIRTSTFGQGNAGTININANERVEILGESREFRNQLISPASQIISQVEIGAQGNAGKVSVATNVLSLQDGGLINTNTLGKGNAGNIEVSATEKVELIGGGELPPAFPSGLSSQVFLEGLGNGGTVNVNTNIFSVQDGGISTSTFGVGDAGNINIVASERVEVSGDGFNGLGGSVISRVFAPGIGNGGVIRIETNVLSLEDGGLISASTSGAGDGGTITVKASESVEVVGDGFQALQENIITPALNAEISGENFNQGIVTISEGAGDAGEINIETSQFTARNGGLLSTTTLGTGEGKNLTIDAQNLITLEDSLLATGTFSPDAKNADSGSIILKADRFIARGGAQALTSTFGASDAGDLIVQVSDAIELLDPTNQGTLLANGLFAATSQQSSGDGGNIEITAGEMTVRDRATVTVGAQGTGTAGDILLTAENLTLLNEASITATTFSADGGNIDLTISDRLSLSNNSTISTTAGERQNAGDGGNININTSFLVAQDNSDITANAFEGDGGNITLSAEGIFGITPREENTSLSDITASSQLGQEGVINIETPETDPASTLTNLPEEEVNVEFARACARSPEQSLAFYNLGRGGLPPTPDRFLPTTEGVEWLALPTSESDDRADSVTTQPVSFFAQPLFSTCASQESTPPK